MNANPYTQLALPTTLTDLLNARETALRLHHDARILTDKAKATLDAVGTYLMPNSAQFRDYESKVIAELDCSLWRRAFDLTGFKQLMDAEAVVEFDRSLLPKPPEFTDANIRATFIDLHGKAGEMFRRGIVNVFRQLSDDYKTNSNEPFRIGRKAVMGYMVKPAFNRGLQVDYGLAGSRLNDIDRIIKTLDKKHFNPREFEYAINVALEKSEVFEDAYYRVKGFKNGNLHIEFKRDDLLDGLNDQIAEHYADGALAHQRK